MMNLDKTHSFTHIMDRKKANRGMSCGKITKVIKRQPAKKSLEEKMS